MTKGSESLCTAQLLRHMYMYVHLYFAYEPYIMSISLLQYTL